MATVYWKTLDQSRFSVSNIECKARGIDVRIPLSGVLPWTAFLGRLYVASYPSYVKKNLFKTFDISKRKFWRRSDSNILRAFDSTSYWTSCKLPWKGRVNNNISVRVSFSRLLVICHCFFVILPADWAEELRRISFLALEWQVSAILLVNLQWRYRISRSLIKQQTHRPLTERQYRFEISFFCSKVFQEPDKTEEKQFICKLV